MQYIGARYTTKVYENSNDPLSAEWEAGVTYEPLTLVTYNNGSYLSKKTVPGNVGDPPSNPSYWTQTGFYNGQIAQIMQNLSYLNGVIITPEEYGAVGDGITDDSQAFNDAIESIPDGGVLFLTNGKTYNIASNIQMKYDDLTLFGYGATIISDNSTGAAYVISARSRDYEENEWKDDPLRLKNIKILGVTIIGGVTESCLVMNCDHVTIKDCHFEQSGSDAFEVRYCTQVDIDNCYSKPNNYYGLMLYQSQNVNVGNCTIHGVTQGVTVKGHIPTDNRVLTNIHDCLITVSAQGGVCIGTGVVIDEGDTINLSVVNNILQYLNADYSNGIGVRLGYVSRRSLISNNRFIGIGIQILGDYHTIIGNSFESYSEPNHATIWSNYLIDSPHKDHNVIKGNVFLGSNINYPFITINHDYCVIEDNVFQNGRGGYEIANAGTHNIIKNNTSMYSGNGMYQEIGTASARYNKVIGNIVEHQVSNFTPYDIVDTAGDFLDNFDISITHRTAAPTAYKHYQGEFVPNAEPTVSGGKIIIGWICTTTGSPGTWQNVEVSV